MAEIVPVDKKASTVRALLQTMVPQLAAATGAEVTAKRLSRIAMTSCLRNPRLLDCDPKTLAGAVMVCAQMGLEPDGYEAHLVPFRNNKRNVYEVQLIPDYKGLMKLARQSGGIKVLDFREVREGDKFSYQYGMGAFLKHEPAEGPIHLKDGKEWKERAITHCYAMAVLDSGEIVFEVMRKEDIEWHRDRYSRAAGDGPWVTNFDSMGAKTCVRKLSKKMPRATMLMRASDLDDKAEQGISQELGAVVVGDDEAPEAPAAETPATNGAPQSSSKLATLTEELKRPPAAAASTPTSETSGAPIAASPAAEPTPPPPATPPAQTPPAQPAPSGQTPGKPAEQTPAGDPKVEGARQPSGGTAPVKDQNAIMRGTLLDRMNARYEELGLAAQNKKAQREFLWGRYIGVGVKEDEADVEKLQNLVTELDRLAAVRKKK